MTGATLFAFMLCWSFLVSAQIPVPALTSRVTDQTSTLTAEQTATLEQTLQAFETKKGTQLAVLIIPSTTPEPIEQYALRVAEQWKLGRKKTDDGAILVVAKNDRALRIEVGYGLEGALNDAVSKRIISEIITPRFQSGDFYGGITAGIGQIIRVVDGETLPAPKERPLGVAEVQRYAPVLFILLLGVGGVLRLMLGKFAGALVTGGAVGVVAWLLVGALSIAFGAGLLALLFTLFSGGIVRRGIAGHPRGGFGGGGFGGGGFGGGGSSGGGFSGGGGGFGGGGASGKW
jgi:uncharacterized protein